jgi:hypothetical protein
MKRRVRLRTIHDHAHILDEAVDALESLSSGSPNLVLRESVQPLQHRFDVLPSEKFPYKFYYIALRNVLLQRERTHLAVAP